MSFSIIICTYNPESDIFLCLLNAILQFDKRSPTHEVIIVDNNSSPGLERNELVRDFLKQKQNARIINETKPGLTAARLAGINESKHDWIVFFDDDNEPNADYLIRAAEAIDDYPQVGAWGPGKVKVIYTSSYEPWLESQKDLFQQRAEMRTIFDNQQSWQEYYPFGTGLVIKKIIAVEYALRVENGVYTLSDRKGKSLSSGGDVQLVFTGIQMGYFAGVIAELKLTHLIDASKANIKYLVKQQYGTASASIKAFNQVFINTKIDVQPVSNYIIIKRIYSLYRIHRSRIDKKDFQLLVASKMGEINAAGIALGSSKPFVLKWFEKLINA